MTSDGEAREETSWKQRGVFVSCLRNAKARQLEISRSYSYPNMGSFIVASKLHDLPAISILALIVQQGLDMRRQSTVLAFVLDK